MSTLLAFEVPDSIARQVTRLASRAGRTVDQLLTDTVLQALCPWANSASIPVTELGDAEVERLADMRLPFEVDDRLSVLLSRQREGEMQPEDDQELRALMEFYEEGQLRKAEALAEAVRRGIMEFPQL